MAGRPLHRADDRAVAGAPADLARDRFPDLSLGGVRIAVEQRPGGHHHARGAEAALQSVTLHKTLLDRVELAALFEILDGAYLVAAGAARPSGPGALSCAARARRPGVAGAGGGGPRGSGARGGAAWRAPSPSAWGAVEGCCLRGSRPCRPGPRPHRSPGGLTPRLLA